MDTTFSTARAARLQILGAAAKAVFEGDGAVY